MPLPEDEVFQGAELPPVKPRLQDLNGENFPERSEDQEFDLLTDQPKLPTVPKSWLPAWLIID